MALINIEYGSLASSETMNKNFMYLDDKIGETSESIMTSISSILSNIATINTKLNELSENNMDSAEKLSSKLEEYKNKTKLLVQKHSMVPDWSNCISISVDTTSSYTVQQNGYLLILPISSAKGNLYINNTVVVYKKNNNAYDNSSQLVFVPVLSGDVVSSDFNVENAYYLASKSISLDDF